MENNKTFQCFFPSCTTIGSHFHRRAVKKFKLAEQEVEVFEVEDSSSSSGVGEESEPQLQANLRVKVEPEIDINVSVNWQEQEQEKVLSNSPAAGEVLIKQEPELVIEDVFACDLEMEIEEEEEREKEKEKEKERETGDILHPTNLGQESNYEQESVDGPAAAEEKSVYFSCTICRRNFLCPDQLAEHAEREHSVVVKLRQCNYCSFRYVQSSDLARHIDNVHADRPTPFACELEICRQRFSSARALSEHRKRHIAPDDQTDQRKFACLVPDCQRTYFTLSGLARHNKNTHLPKQQFRCQDGCGQMFDSLKKQNQHRQEHIAEGEKQIDEQRRERAAYERGYQDAVDKYAVIFDRARKQQEEQRMQLVVLEQRQLAQLNSQIPREWELDDFTSGK